MFGIQSHLDIIAFEGLRTLVLCLQILIKEQCNKWLEENTATSTYINDRNELLTKLAFQIKKELHNIGGMSIEDKLQDTVKETIQKLGKSGIKLWILISDKKEMAVDIGYSTYVLTASCIHVTEETE